MTIAQWLARCKLSNQDATDLCNRISRRHGYGELFSPFGFKKYRKSDRIALSDERMQCIYEASEGKVTPNDLYPFWRRRKAA